MQLRDRIGHARHRLNLRLAFDSRLGSDIGEWSNVGSRGPRTIAMGGRDMCMGACGSVSDIDANFYIVGASLIFFGGI